tara:strand:- start:327 stop:500 length:174 start_codon:yes stop_codon:yes gene_type:complete
MGLMTYSTIGYAANNTAQLALMINLVVNSVINACQQYKQSAFHSRLNNIQREHVITF